MTLCNLCTEHYFDFDGWHTADAKSHHTCGNVWADAIEDCSICLTMAEAVQQAIFGNTKSTLDLSDIVRQSHLPLYEVFLHECAARDQWELEFKPIESKILWRENLTIELPVRIFKVFATYYDSVRPRPAKIDVTERFRQHSESQKQPGVQKEQITLGVELKAKDVPQSSAEQKADASTANQKAPCQDQNKLVATNSRSAFNQFKSWLEDCENHELCKNLGEPDQSNPFVPTRLLEVGPGNTISRIETRNFGDKKYWRYATLSHCWGKKGEDEPPPEFRNEDVEKSGQPIEIESLPANFRHAIEAVRILGIDYIWIDSLCIIQDSEADQKIELPKMEQIYAHSFLNIAAANSRNSQGGLFRDRKLALLSSIVQVGEVLYKVIRKDLWDGELLSEPLYKRAWVLQERALAPRTIHFGRQVFWQCLSVNACEVMPKGIPLVIDSGREELKWRRLLQQKEHSTQDLVNLRGIWQHLIKTYKSCGISYPSDVLRALNGLVTRIQKISLEKSYAGLWEKELVEQLAWRVLKPNKRYEPYCAPTWSWASVDALVELPPRVVRETDYKLHFIRCDIKDDGSARIESACLHVKGYVFQSEIGTYHPDSLDCPYFTGAAKRLVLPLYYKSTNTFVNGWGLAVVAREKSYERVGLVEWRDVPGDLWVEEMYKRGEDKTMEIR